MSVAGQNPYLDWNYDINMMAIRKGVTLAKNRLLEFSSVRVNIPRKFILKCLRKETITSKEKEKIRRKLREIEKNIYMLQHAKSIVDNCVDKDIIPKSKRL
jgi:hypothetical protein